MSANECQQGEGGPGRGTGASGKDEVGPYQCASPKGVLSENART